MANDMFSSEALKKLQPQLNFKQAKTGNQVEVKFDTKAGEQIVKDVGNVARGVVKGAGSAVVQAYQAIPLVPGVQDKIAQFVSPYLKPNEEEQTAYDIGKYTTAIIPSLMFKNIGMQNAVAAGGSTLVAEEHDKNLADIAQQLGLDNVIIDALTTKADDTTTERNLKNFATDFIGSTTVTATINTLSRAYSGIKSIFNSLDKPTQDIVLQEAKDKGIGVFFNKTSPLATETSKAGISTGIAGYQATNVDKDGNITFNPKEFITTASLMYGGLTVGQQAFKEAAPSTYAKTLFSASKDLPVMAQNNPELFMKIMERGSSVKPVDTQLNIFVGVGGLSEKEVYVNYTAGNLRQAEQLAMQGHNAEDVWTQTGWFKGKDDLWRFELPVNTNQVKDYTTVLNEAKVLPNGDRTIPLNNVLDANHPIFKAYPELINTNVMFSDMPNTTANGMFDWETNTIVINNSKEKQKMLKAATLDIPTDGSTRTVQTMQELIMHELSHNVQELEGFAKGGSSDLFIDTNIFNYFFDENLGVRKTISGDIKIITNTDEYQRLQMIKNTYLRKVIEEQGDDKLVTTYVKSQLPSKYREDHRYNYLPKKDESQYYSFLQEQADIEASLFYPEYRDATVLQNKYVVVKDNYEAYRALSGEVEARLSEKRFVNGYNGFPLKQTDTPLEQAILFGVEETDKARLNKIKFKLNSLEKDLIDNPGDLVKAREYNDILNYHNAYSEVKRPNMFSADEAPIFNYDRMTLSTNAQNAIDDIVNSEEFKKISSIPKDKKLSEISQAAEEMLTTLGYDEAAIAKMVGGTDNLPEKLVYLKKTLATKIEKVLAVKNNIDGMSSTDILEASLDFKSIVDLIDASKTVQKSAAQTVTAGRIIITPEEIQKVFQEFNIPITEELSKTTINIKTNTKILETTIDTLDNIANMDESQVVAAISRLANSSGDLSKPLKEIITKMSVANAGDIKVASRALADYLMDIVNMQGKQATTKVLNDLKVLKGYDPALYDSLIETFIPAEHITSMKETLKRSIDEADQITTTIKNRYRVLQNNNRIADILTEVGINGMISSFSTHLLAAASNLSLGLLHTVEKPLAYLWGVVLQSKDRMKFNELLAFYNADVTSAMDTFSALWYAFNKDKRGIQSIEDAFDKQMLDSYSGYVGANRAISQENILGITKDPELIARGLKSADDASFTKQALGIMLDTVGTVIRLPRMGMSTIKDVFARPYYSGSMYEIATREANKLYPNEVAKQEKLINDLVEYHKYTYMSVGDLKLLDEATREKYAQIHAAYGDRLHKEAIERVREINLEEELRGAAQDSTLNKLAYNLQSFISKTPYVSLILPFFRVSANSFREVIRRTPGLSLLSQRFMDDMAAGGARRDMALAKVTMGTGLYTIGYNLWTNNQLVPNATDDNERQAMQNAGIQPNSIIINGKSIPLERFEPLSSFLTMTADAASLFNKAMYRDNANQEELAADAENIHKAIAMTIYNNIGNRLFLKQVSQMINAIKTGNIDFLNNTISNLAPYGSLSKQFNMTENKKYVDGLMDKFREKYCPSDLPDAVDAFGEPIVNERTFGFVGTRISDDPVRQELYRIGVAPTIMDNKFTYHKTEIQLERDDYLAMLKSVKTNPKYSLHDVISKAMDSKGYAEASDYMKRDVMRGLISNYKSYVKGNYVMSNPQLLKKYKTMLEKTKRTYAPGYTNPNEPINYFQGGNNE